MSGIRLFESSPRKILERDVEKALINRVKSLGGLCEKFLSGRRSVPDRIVTLPGGKICFIELKRPGGSVTPLQRKDHDRRRELGAMVFVIDNMEDAHAFTF